MKSENIPFERSFASYPKSEFWSSKNKLKPHQVYKYSITKYWFSCNICKHSFEGGLNNISQGKWCSYCSNKILCENEECIFCFEKSFASHTKSKFWSNKNKNIPRNIFKNTIKQYFFNCNNCNHTFETSLNHISSSNSWCPYCCQAPKLLCENNDCKECFEKSFASNPLNIYWSNKNTIIPRNIFKTTGKRYWFNCNLCKHIFEMRIADITYRNSWCTNCKHKTELKLFNWLKEQNFNVISQGKFDWCKKERKLPFDFVIEEHKLIFELDGAQHFRQVSNWQSPKESKINDDFKNKSSLDNGYRMIRICQEIVLFEKEDWENQLQEAINSKEKLIKIGSVYNV